MGTEETSSVQQGDMEKMQELLLCMMNPEAAPSATQELKTLLQNPASLVLVFSHLFENPKQEVRQMASVLLRKRILKQWSQLPPDIQEQTKQRLLNSVTAETEHNVRVANSHLLAAVGRVTVDDWGDTLCEFMGHLSQSESVQNREVAMTVLTSLIDGAGDKLEKHYQQFANTFGRGLADPASVSLQIASLRGVQNLALAMDSDQASTLLRPLLQPICQLINTTLTEGTEEVAQLALEILDDFVEHSNVFKAEDIPYIVDLMLRCAAKSELDCGLRDQALHFIHWIAKKKPKSLYRDGLVLKILDVVIPIGAEKEPEGLDAEELCGHRIASQCVDSLAINLPNKYIYYPVIERLRPYIQSSNPLQKKAALVLLGVMSEGCESVMRDRLGEILPFVFSSFKDPNPEVQGAAATSFTQLAEYLQPEIFGYHEEAMSNLLAVMDSKDTATQERACYALEVFCEELGSEEIQPYLPSLLPKLVAVLTATGNSDVRENCLGAIGAIAASSDKQFDKYANECLALLKNILEHEGGTDEIIAVKSKAIECVGIIGKSIGPEKFEPYHQGFIDLVFQNVDQLDSSLIRRAAFFFWGNLATAMEMKYLGYLEKTMVYIFASLFSSDGIESTKDGQLDDLGDDSDEDDDSHFNVRTGLLDELESAMSCLEVLWDVMPVHCMKYIRKTTEGIDVLYQHFASDVRQATASLMVSVLKGVHGQFPGEVSAFVPGLPVTQQYIHGHTMKIWNEKFCEYFHALLDDNEKETVTNVVGVLGELIESLGPELIAPPGQIDELVKFLIKILTNKHECQKHTEIDEDEESRLEEENLFEGIASLIAGMSKALGGQFAEIYAKLHPRVVILATHRKSSAYRCIGLGCAAGAFESMGTTAEQFVPPLIGTVIESIRQHKDLVLRRNAAFASGIFIQVSPALAASANVAEILKALHPILIMNREDMTEKENLVTDNALATIARIVLHCPSSSLPLHEILPLFFQQLPLVEDLEENPVVMKALIQLFATTEAQPIIEKHVGKFLATTVQETTSEDSTIDLETRNKLNTVNITAIKQLGPEHSAVQGLIETLPNKTKTQEYLHVVLNTPDV